MSFPSEHLQIAASKSNKKEIQKKIFVYSISTKILSISL